MKTVIILLIGICVSLYSCPALAQTDFLNSPEYSCIQCLCHARTGCWRRENCASYSIDKNYWTRGGRLVVDATDDPNTDDAFQKCMRNENCIVGTVINYTNSFKQKDCNCDEKFDCKDRLALHLFGENCANPQFGETYARRFNDCAKRLGVPDMLSKEGNENCQADILPDAQ